MDSWRVAYAGIVPRAQIEERSYERRVEQWREALGWEDQVALLAEVHGDIAGFSTYEASGHWDRPGEADRSFRAGSRMSGDGRERSSARQHRRGTG